MVEDVEDPRVDSLPDVEDVRLPVLRQRRDEYRRDALRHRQVHVLGGEDLVLRHVEGDRVPGEELHLRDGELAVGHLSEEPVDDDAVRTSQDVVPDQDRVLGGPSPLDQVVVDPPGRGVALDPPAQRLPVDVDSLGDRREDVQVVAVFHDDGLAVVVERPLRHRVEGHLPHGLEARGGEVPFEELAGDGPHHRSDGVLGGEPERLHSGDAVRPVPVAVPRSGRPPSVIRQSEHLCSASLLSPRRPTEGRPRTRAPCRPSSTAPSLWTGLRRLQA